MTKAAIAHLTKCLAVEWARHGINVNAVAPTFIKTPGHGEVAGGRRVPRRPAGAHPARAASASRSTSPAAVVFLASPAASLITGATLLIDGGFTAR